MAVVEAIYLSKVHDDPPQLASQPSMRRPALIWTFGNTFEWAGRLGPKQLQIATIAKGKRRLGHLFWN